MTNHSIDQKNSQACLAFAVNCSPEHAANILRSHGYAPEVNWTLFATNAAHQVDAETHFASRIIFDENSGAINTDAALNAVLRHNKNYLHFALILGASPSDSLFTEYALFGANIPARHRFVLSDSSTQPLEKYINMHCKPTESEWAESDGDNIACTLYGNVGQRNSGLHSLFLGKSAYEKFIDSYYLDDLIKTKYTGYHPEKFYYIIYFALVCCQKTNPSVAFTELGATLWGTIDKIDICHSKLNLSYDVQNVEWNSIELSDYLRKLSHLLHQNLNLNYFDKWQNYLRKDVEIGFSHLVSPYAFHDEISTINWVKSFGFCLWVNDFTFSEIKHLKVNGKAWTLLPLKSTIDHLKQSNLGVYLIDSKSIDPEGQIKRISMVIFDKDKFSIDQYFDLIKSEHNLSHLRPEDFRNFDFDPSGLWEKFTDDPDYFSKCAQLFSAGFAGALAITPTKPYEFKWVSTSLASRIKEHLKLIRDGNHVKKNIDTFKSRLVRLFRAN